MLCPVCHTQNRDNAKFCKGCGLSFTPEMVETNQAGQNASASPVAQPTPQVSPDPGAQQVEVPGPTTETALSDLPTVPAAQDFGEFEDLSQVPTQILTPQQMVALQTRRWQQELEREQQEQSSPEQPEIDIAEAPTVLIPLHNEDSGETQDTALPTNQQSPVDIADMPTTIIPLETEASPQTDQEHEEVEVATSPNTEAESIPSPETEQEQGGQEQAVQTPSETEAFPLLEPGTQVIGRYEVTQVLSDDADVHVYQVIDHQGYQQCWNCGSQENAEGDEFCIDCGAELLNATYLMHEYPASRQQNEERVLTGLIVNTFVDQGLTYIIEQPQASQNDFPDGVRLLAAGESDAGNVRRSEPNEDSTLVVQLQRVHESHSEPVGVYIVADGLGGHENGQVASRMTIDIIAERLIRELISPPLLAEKNGEEIEAPDEDSLVVLLQSAVEDANTLLCQKNQRDKTDMGSTITGFMIVGDHAYILNVGDSRTYLLRDSTLRQLTNDHSLVGQLVAGGLIEPDDVYTHPQRSQIFRSLGDKLNVQIDIFKQQVHPGDILLSCSDGLWEMIRNPQIEEILINATDPQSACSRLIETANNNGGEDNVSAVVVHVR
ncbi:MAG TPA: protein phosphatase 2C domain-containing protein [Ktedonobacteraceae bacterium]|nr:protein phosphatase 2C domain-containing protein [Ktedonobacteraceae bacterium]